MSNLAIRKLTLKKNQLKGTGKDVFELLDFVPLPPRGEYQDISSVVYAAAGFEAYLQEGGWPLEDYIELVNTLAADRGMNKILNWALDHKKQVFQFRESYIKSVAAWLLEDEEPSMQYPPELKVNLGGEFKEKLSTFCDDYFPAGKFINRNLIGFVVLRRACFDALAKLAQEYCIENIVKRNSLFVFKRGKPSQRIQRQIKTTYWAYWKQERPEGAWSKKQSKALITWGRAWARIRLQGETEVKVAETLNITPSELSSRIKNFDEAFGYTLRIRGRPKIEYDFAY